MDVAQILMSGFDASILKEPRGFMKILQFLFTICAFATTTSFNDQVSIQVKCDNGTEDAIVPVSYSFKYCIRIFLPLILRLYQYNPVACGRIMNFFQDFSSDSEFFVFIFVIAFLCTISILCFYVLFNKMYEEDVRLPTADFFLHCMLGILMLACSSAWANSLTGLKRATEIDTIISENKKLCENGCTIVSAPNFSKLNISIIFGFLNTFLFVSNIWFIYKETIFFTGKEPVQQQQQQQQTTISG